MGLLEQKFECDNQLCKKKHELQKGYVGLTYKNKWETRIYYFCGNKCIMKFLEIETMPFDENEEE